MERLTHERTALVLTGGGNRGAISGLSPVCACSILGVVGAGWSSTL